MMLKQLKKNKYIKFSYSLKLTVICLIILTALTIFGTIYQSDHGLYEAKAKFFSSWIFLLGGFIPFPGGALTMSVLFLNLTSAIFFRIGFRLKNIGNILTHLGILILLIGGFYTFLFSTESSIMLKENSGSAFSSSYDNWEVASFEIVAGKSNVYAKDTKYIKKGSPFVIPGLNLSGTVKEFHSNCTAFKSRSNANDSDFINASGIESLRELPPDKEPSNNSPGIILSLNGVEKDILLYGNEQVPTAIELNGKKIFLSIRKKKFRLPFFIKLNDFRMQKYPGSEIVKSYDSFVEITNKAGIKRKVHISMNKPLRYEDFTLFQSSYYIDRSNGAEYSILAVVKNKGKYLPYISSIIVFLGMTLHFILMLIRRRNSREA